MLRREAYVPNVIEEVLRATEEEVDPSDNLSVSTWYGKNGDTFHITLGRINQRTGYEKRIAIPQEDVIPVLAQMIRQMAGFRYAIDVVKEERMRSQG